MADDLEIDGRRVSVDRIGSGPPIVCLPRGPGFPGAQVGELGGLTSTHELLRLDLRGAGASDPPSNGRYGVAVGEASANGMAAAMPNASVAIIGDAGHSSWLERPGAYVQAVRDFLSSD